MKLRRNRIAFQGDKGNLEWYRLQNKMRNSVSSFATVSISGIAYASHANGNNGVRPVFKIRNL